jgi:Rieske Fe-S protein
VALSRRGFVTRATWSALGAALAACGGGGGGETIAGTVEPPVAGAAFNGNVLTVPLSGAPDLAAANGFHVFSSPIGGVQPNVIVINLGGGLFRAFTSICTHEQCTVSDFSGGRINCPCHGSQFDTTGRNVVGPAPSPLREFATRLDAATQTLTVTKS